MYISNLLNIGKVMNALVANLRSGNPISFASDCFVSLGKEVPFL
jgi:hypothetical protein